MFRVIGVNLVPMAALIFAAAGHGVEMGAVNGAVVATGLANNANIVISLEAPNLEVRPPAQPVEMDQKNRVFVPHVLAVMRGTTIRFLNSDGVAHNVFSPEGRYDLGSWSQGQSKQYTLRKAGVYTQLCHLHPEMEAFVIVLDTPYFATTNDDGAFQIPNVPSGNYTLAAWSEKLKRATQPIAVQSGNPMSVHLTLTR
jgi:plastocyanin